MSNPEESKPVEKQPNSIAKSLEDTKSLVSSNAEPTSLIPAEKIASYYEEAMECIKNDRSEAEQRYLDFAEMVFNEGDPSSASKEALVNLLKLKHDGVNQMIKILDLMTRIHNRDKATSSQIYAYQQNNKYEVGSNRPNPHVKRLIEMAKDMEANNDKSE